MNSTRIVAAVGLVILTAFTTALEPNAEDTAIDGNAPPEVVELSFDEIKSDFESSMLLDVMYIGVGDFRELMQESDLVIEARVEETAERFAASTLKALKVEKTYRGEIGDGLFLLQMKDEYALQKGHRYVLFLETFDPAEYPFAEQEGCVYADVVGGGQGIFNLLDGRLKGTDPAMESGFRALALDGETDVDTLARVLDGGM